MERAKRKTIGGFRTFATTAPHGGFAQVFCDTDETDKYIRAELVGMRIREGPVLDKKQNAQVEGMLLSATL